MNSNRKNLAILFFTMVVIMLGFGMVMPVFPFILTQMGASGDEYPGGIKGFGAGNL